MAIKVKAIERNISFIEGQEKWAYVLQPDLYNKLSSTKVIQEAALRSGINKGAINAAWDAIGEVIKAWATEGHSVAVPGLGSLRFGLRSTSVADVNKVGVNLITSRRVIFVPNTDIKKELADTSVNITCYNRKGEVVKRVLASGGDVEDTDEDGNYIVTVVTADSSHGSVTGGGTFTQGATCTIKAMASQGYVFDRWSDGSTDAERVVTVNQNMQFTASFKPMTTGGGDTPSGGSGGGSGIL